MICIYLSKDIYCFINIKDSLKIKEISYVHNKAFAVSDKKHVSISLIEEVMPVAAMATPSNLFKKIVNSVIYITSG